MLRQTVTRTNVCLGLLLLVIAGTCRADPVDFESPPWVLKDARAVDHLGRKCLTGTAYLEGLEFQNGIIEVDLAVDGSRAYPGLIFRAQSPQELERLYLRPHRAGLYPDALQYAPVFNGVTCWQLYHGEGFTAPASIPRDQWIHLRLEVKDQQARLFMDRNPQPALTITDLKHGVSKGTIGVLSEGDGVAYFSDFRYEMTDDLEFGGPTQAVAAPGLLMDWEMSQAFPANAIDRTRYPHFSQIFSAGWRPVAAEASGLVNISRYVSQSSPGAFGVMARTIVSLDQPQSVKVSFGYSDDVTVFLNGRPVFSGISGYRSRDPSFVGAIGLHDALYLPMQKGLNEIFLMVAETFGGSGFMCQADRSLPPRAKRHELLTKVWETPPVFKVPECVAYDPKRNVLYVSSFNKLVRPNDHTGFISRIALDGRVEDPEWVTNLDGPCGMVVDQDKLFVAECTGHLAEIDIPGGRVAQRYRVADSTFLNDVAMDSSGAIFISDTTQELAARDIHMFKDGTVSVWKQGDDLHRVNGLLVDGQDVIAGSVGDGLLKRVRLQDGRVDVVTSLGAGVIDGIRADGKGNYLVSHWEGRAYLISPSGEVTEILDTMSAGQNIADFEFVRDSGLLIVPTFVGNTVAAYRLSQN